MSKPITDTSANSGTAWFFIKLSLLIFWLGNMAVMLTQVSPAALLPVGFNKLVHLSFLFTTPGKVSIAILLFTLSMLYLLEKSMRYVLIGQFLLSVIIISQHESSGMFHHATVFSPLFAVQAIAYWQSHRNHEFNLAHFRTQYSIQIIAATYTLAGISKLTASGLDWVNSGNYFALQVIKNYSFIYFGEGDKQALSQGYAIAGSMFQHAHLIQLLLAGSLFLELFCFTALISHRVRVLYAIALVAMHTGILIVMGIPFGVIAPVMIIFFLNPLFFIATCAVKVRSFILKSI